MGVFDGIGSAISGGVVSGGLGLLNNIGANRRARKQLEQQEAAQKRLNEHGAELNYQYGEMAADAAHQRSLGLLEAETEANSYVNQVADAKEAGLSVGLLYGGGPGGTGGSAGGGAQGGGAGNQKGAAPDYLEVEAIKQARKQAHADLMKSINEGRLVVAEKEKVETETEEIKSNIDTSNELTPFQKELLREQATAILIENIRKDWENLGGRNKIGDFKDMDYTSKELGRYIRINEGSIFDKRTAEEVAEISSRIEGNKALAGLNTEKKKGYWAELMNATAIADSEEIKAAAIKLGAEHATGEYTNWKTWKDIAFDIWKTVLGAAGDAAKASIGK